MPMRFQVLLFDEDGKAIAIQFVDAPGDDEARRLAQTVFDEHPTAAQYELLHYPRLIQAGRRA